MTRLKLGEIAHEYKGKAKESEMGVLPIVGLEHLSSGDIDLVGFSEGGESTFTKKFLPGHVLFGRRRAYQRKASLAEFPGICSGDITVIEADEGALEPRLLPFIIQNDSLFDFAVENSAGSLSPRVKWARLAEYELDLPTLEKQRELADVLWAAQDVRRKYKLLLRASDDIVKSRFVEMFGSDETGYLFGTKKLGTLLSVEPQNGLYKPQSYYVDDDSGTPIVRVDAFQTGVIENYHSLKRLMCTTEEVETYRLNENDIVINRVNGSIERVGKIAWIRGLLEPTVFESNMMRFHVDETTVALPFVAAFMNSDDMRRQIKASAHVANQCSINQSNVANFDIPIASMELQGEFASFASQVDKSKVALQQSLDELNATMAAILNEELGTRDV